MFEDITDEEFYSFGKRFTSEEIDQDLKYLEDHPLFIDSQEKLENSNNEMVEALRNLAYDEDPEVLVENLYKQGNVLLTEKILK